jgi:NADH-quinone oxidoreductase subunit A
MQTPLFDLLFPLTALVLLAVLVPVGMISANWFIHRKHSTFASKDEAYECGLSQTVGSANERFSVKFYLVAMLFLAFDIEVAFLYPWAIQFREGGLPALWTFLVFLVIFEATYIYLWRKGALNWEK